MLSVALRRVSRGMLLSAAARPLSSKAAARLIRGRQRLLGRWGDEYMPALKAFSRAHGDLFVPSTFSTENGFKLGRLVSSIRTGKTPVPDEFKERLSEMGFVMNCKDHR